MRATWDVKDIVPGIAAAKPTPSGWYMPVLIGYNWGLGGGKAVGLVSLQDGQFMVFGGGTPEALVDYLNEGGYVPVHKLHADGPRYTLPENRLGLPQLVIIGGAP